MATKTGSGTGTTGLAGTLIAAVGHHETGKLRIGGAIARHPTTPLERGLHSTLLGLQRRSRVRLKTTPGG